MNKIIPIICLVVAAFGLCVATVGIITVALAVRVSGLALVAVPTAIAGAVISGVSTVVTALFRRDKLCRIAFFINLAALILSVVSIIVWFAAL